METAVAIVPPRIQLWLGVLLAENVGEAPRAQIAEYFALWLAGVRCANEYGWVPYVDIGWRNVEIACNHDVFGWLGNGVYVIAQLLHPTQFVLVVLVFQFATIWHIHAHHFYAVACCANNARFGIGLACCKVGHHIG